MSGKRRYSDEERAAALACLDACGGNVAEASRRSGVPRITLHDWARGRTSAAAASVVRQDKKEELADVFERLARKLTGVADRESDTLNAKDATIAAGVAVDKMLLLRGEPTQVAKVIIADDERDAAVERLLARLGETPGRPTPDRQPSPN